MNEAAATGLLLTFISAIALGIGLAKDAMPFNYQALDTSRKTSPIIFWGFAAFYTLSGFLGIAIAVRHFTI